VETGCATVHSDQVNTIKTDQESPNSTPRQVRFKDGEWKATATEPHQQQHAVPPSSPQRRQFHTMDTRGHQQHPRFGTQGNVVPRTNRGSDDRRGQWNRPEDRRPQDSRYEEQPQRGDRPRYNSGNQRGSWPGNRNSAGNMNYAAEPICYRCQCVGHIARYCRNIAHDNYLPSTRNRAGPR
jgi:hypothetical protein